MPPHLLLPPPIPLPRSIVCWTAAVITGTSADPAVRFSGDARRRLSVMSHRARVSRRLAARRHGRAPHRSARASAVASQQRDRFEDARRDGLAGDRNADGLKHLAGLDSALLDDTAQRLLNRVGVKRLGGRQRRAGVTQRFGATVGSDHAIERRRVVNRAVEQERHQRPEVRQRLDLLPGDLDRVTQAGATGEGLQPLGQLVDARVPVGGRRRGSAASSRRTPPDSWIPAPTGTGRPAAAA